MTTTAETHSLLTEWTAQVQALMDAPNQAHAVMSQMYTSFGELHLKLSEAGDLDTAALVAASYDHALTIYNQGAGYERALTAGQVVIRELDQQRTEAVRELSGLLDAIKRGNEAHPALRWYAVSIRAEEREALLDSDEVWMMADESLVDDIYKHLTTEYGLPFGAAKTLLNMISGAQTMNEDQRAAFEAFWPAIDPDRKGSS